MADYFTITRQIAAPRELVFDAITKPEHFAVWFGTAAVEVPQESLSMDVRPGGEFRATMVLPDGNRIDWAGEYITVDPPAHLAMTLSDNPDAYAGLPVLFDLEEL
ncbi:MAG: SRPBCC domain-containing protein, partial [Microbacterium sp.]